MTTSIEPKWVIVNLPWFALAAENVPCQVHANVFLLVKIVPVFLTGSCCGGMITPGGNW